MGTTAMARPMPQHYELSFLPDEFPSSVEFDFSRPETGERYQAAGERTLRPVVIEDIRGREADFVLFRNGFQYLHHELPLDPGGAPLTEMTEEDIAAVLVHPTELLVKEITGAFKVITAGYRLRNLIDDPRRQLGYHGPSHEVHCDFSAAGAVRYLERDLLRDDPAAWAALWQKRTLVVNVWRPLAPIKRDPLAICDWQSVEPSRSSLVPWKVSFENGARQNESLKVRRHESQRWYHLKGQLPSEPVVFLCFDSCAEGAMTVPHSAFVDPDFADGEPRVSFEVKLYCFLDK